MEYSIKQLSVLSGITSRTIRYYHEIGLLNPLRISSSGYRIYGEKQIDLLQQILFYRELGVELETIKKIITDEDFDSERALEGHLSALLEKRKQVDRLIDGVQKTLLEKKGEIKMATNEKFEAFKKDLVHTNESKYGKESREKYGEHAVNRSNDILISMTDEQYSKIEILQKEMESNLKIAAEIGDVTSELSQTLFKQHKEWITFYWGEYSEEGHKSLAQMYVDDARFKAYYDIIGENCAEFLRDVVFHFCEE